jgi:hypothetical protein
MPEEDERRLRFVRRRPAREAPAAETMEAAE